MTKAFQKGFGLLELVTAVTVLGILVSLAIPSFADIIDARRLQAALHAVQSHVQQVRSDAIKRNRAMAISYVTQDDGSWAIGYREGSLCNPMENDIEEDDACAIDFNGTKALTLLSSDRFPTISFDANRTLTRFEPVRGTAMGTNVTLVLKTQRGAEARVIVSNIGRIRLCSPAGPRKLALYSAC